MMRRDLLMVAQLAAILFLTVIPGCGSSSPQPADAASARDALERALTAWQAGKPVDSLKNDSPPIVVSDHVWNKGTQLVKYQVGKDQFRVGADQSFTVVLWVKDDRGKEKKQTTQYYVGTNPILTVVRPF